MNGLAKQIVIYSSQDPPIDSIMAWTMGRWDWVGGYMAMMIRNDDGQTDSVSHMRKETDGKRCKYVIK